MSRKFDALKRQSKYEFKDGAHYKSFGVSLKEAFRAPGHKIPLVPETLIEFLQSNALSTEGLLRIPGGFNEVSALLQDFDEGAVVDLSKYEHNSISEVLKKYLAELPEPLVPPMIDQLVKTLFAPDVQRKPLDEILGEMKFAIDSLPEINNEMLRRLTKFLSLLIANSSKNRMTLSNVVMCIAPVLHFTPAILTYCIQHHDYFFRGANEPAPPLRLTVESPPVARAVDLTPVSRVAEPPPPTSPQSVEATVISTKVLDPNSKERLNAAARHKRISITFDLKENGQISQIELPLDVPVDRGEDERWADERREEEKRKSKEYKEKIMQLQIDVGMWKTVAQRQGNKVDELESELDDAERKYQKERIRCRELLEHVDKLKSKVDYYKDRYYEVWNESRRESNKESRESYRDSRGDTGSLSGRETSRDLHRTSTRVRSTSIPSPRGNERDEYLLALERQQSMDLIAKHSFEKLLASESQRDFKESGHLRPSSDPTSRKVSSRDVRDSRESSTSSMPRVPSSRSVRSRSTPKRRPD